MNPKTRLDGESQTELTGWELIDFVSATMNSSHNNFSIMDGDFFREKLIRSLKEQNINIETLDVVTLRKASLKILTQSLTEELLEK